MARSALCAAMFSTNFLLSSAAGTTIGLLVRQGAVRGGGGCSWRPMTGGGQTPSPLRLRGGGQHAPDLAFAGTLPVCSTHGLSPSAPPGSKRSTQVGVRAMSSSAGIIFRQLFEKESSTYTYLLACPQTKEAVIIDPVLETVDRDLGLCHDLGVELKQAINTHCHADHVTGTGDMKKKNRNVRSGIAKAAGANADFFFEDKDVLTFGEHSLEVRSTPGHTDGCVSFVLDGGKAVFTGDAVLIRGCGRTDFQGGSSDTLYDSVHTQIFTLPDDCVIYPAHDYKGMTSSTVLEERTLNPRLTKTKEEFKDIMANLNLPYPKQIDNALPKNLACGIQD